MKVHFVGDVHGKWGVLNQFINKQKPETIVQVGDFGFFPKEVDYSPSKHVKLQAPTTLYWIDGNHEDHEAIQEHHRYFVPSDRIYYKSRGSALSFGNSRILCIGGAESPDRHMRTPGYDWFPEESITGEDVNKALWQNGTPDVVVSHTCPDFLVPHIGGKNCDFVNNSERALTEVFHLLRPKTWVFGHWHIPVNTEVNGCRFVGLNVLGRTNGWTVLDL